MENRGDTGILLIDKNIKLHRSWFKQMCSLIGINVKYFIPIEKQYSTYGELNPDYPSQPTIVGCIYDEHPTQKTMRKLGWNAELADSSVVIHVPYDLEGLQAGCRFDLPAGIDGAEPKQFKVLRMSNIAAYPASVACELGPVLVNAFKSDPENPSSPNPDVTEDLINDFDDSNFNLLSDESDKYGH